MNQRKKVLIIDNNPVNRDVLAKILCADYEILQEENGKQGLNFFKQHYVNISAVLIDLFMPDMNGFEFLREIGQVEQCRNIPIIVATGSGHQDDEARALELGAWDFVLKPYNADIIRFRVKNAIDRSQLSALKQLQYLAQYDSLTGLYNKDQFYSETQRMLDEIPEKDFALIRFDINRFSLINSYYGSAEGDALLKHIARALCAFFDKQECGTYGRIVSDVFALCLPYTTQEDVYEIIAHLEQVIKDYNHNYDIAANFGICLIRDHSVPVQQLYDWASLAAKNVKGNYVVNYAFYDENMGSQIQKEQEITNEMIAALEQEQFLVYLQPKYNLQNNVLTGAEALVRWKHPEKGMVSPGLFIPIFERNGFVEKLDYYMWEHVCMLLHGWLHKGLHPQPISVNVSRVNLYNPNLVENIYELTKKYDIPVEMLHLELTESAYMDNPDVMKSTIKKLHEKGFIVLMDDFGSGYSSLNILKDIEVDVIKMDMGFMTESEIPKRGENILASMMQMAQWINVPVVAEGVEKKTQVAFLRRIGCEFVQGYYFAKPMPVAEYEQLLRQEAELHHKEVQEEKKVGGENILLILRDEKDREELTKILTQDYCVFAADSISGALAFLGKCDREINLILLDAHLLNEYSFIKERGNGIPIVVVADSASPQNQAEILTHDLNKYIVRPFMPNSVRIYVANTLAADQRFRSVLKDYEKIKKSAHRDGLTGLYNRSAAKNQIECLLHAPQGKQAMMIVDIDNFRQINDMFGHDFGDRVLMEFAAELQRLFRKQDVLARLGGDEFIVFLPDVPSEEWIQEKYADIQQYCSSMTAKGTMVKCSIGAASTTGEEMTFADIYHKADGALYRAKENSRKHYQLADSILSKPDLDQLKIQFMNDPLLGGMFGCYEEDGYPLYFISDYMVHYLGYASQDAYWEDTSGMMENSIHPDDRIQGAADIRQQLKQENEFHITYRFRRADGSYIWLLKRGRRMAVEGGRTVLISFCVDVSENKQLEQRLQAIAQHVPGALAVYACKPTPDGMHVGMTYLSGGWQRLTGYPVEQILQQSKEMACINQDAIPFLTDTIRRAAQEQISCDSIRRFVRKDGEIIWLKFSASPTWDEKGNILYYGVYTDVTSQKQVEQALRGSQAQYQAAMANSGVNVWEYDLREEERRNMLSICYDEVTGKICDLVLHEENFVHKLYPESIKAMQKTLREALHSEAHIGSADLWMYHSSGEDKCVHVVCVLSFFSDGRTVRLYGSSSDISREKRMEQRYQSEELCRKALQSSTDASFKLNLTYNHINDEQPGIYKEVGYSGGGTVDELLAAICKHITTDTNRHAAEIVLNRKNLIERFQRGENTVQGEQEYRSPDTHRLLWIKYQLHLARDFLTGDILGYLYCYDMTDARQYQEISQQIARNNYDFVACVNIPADELRVYVHDELVVEPNGGKYSEIVGRFLSDYIAPDERQAVQGLFDLDNVTRKLRSTSRYAETIRVEKAPGEFCRKLYQCWYLDRQSDIIIATRTDVTHLLEEEELRNQQLAHALTVAEEANQAKSQFLAKMSHDLRTPLNAIMGMSNIGLKNLNNADMMMECMDKTLESSQYLLTLLDDILNLNRVEQGHIQLRQERFDLWELIEDISNTMKHRMNQHNIAYACLRSNGVQRYYIGDDMRLKQILVNLLGNAAKFTPDGGSVSLHVEQPACIGNQATVRFLVSDTGIGIGSTFLKRIFEPFAQEHEGSTTAYEGTGLGLAVARTLARLMHGDITVQSTEGKGSVFTVTVRLEVSAYQAQTSLSHANKLDSLAGARILLVEDHPLNTMVATRLLEARGMQVEHAANGMEGVQKFALSPEQYYDAILMDVRMPVMDGLEAARRIRALGSNYAAQIPIIATTANVYDEDVESCLEAGMNAHLSKPIEPPTLYQTLARFLEKRT